MRSKWKRYTLDAIATIQGGGTPSRSEASYFGGGLPWVTPSDLPPIGKVETLGVVKQSLSLSGLQHSSAKRIPSGSVLFSSRASIGKIAVTEHECATNQGFINLTPAPDKLCPWFLAYLLCRYTPDLVGLAGKTTFLEIPRGKFKKFEVAVPDLTEQRRIVTRIKDCVERVDEIEGLHKEESKIRSALMRAARREFLGHPSELATGWTEERLDELAGVIYGISEAISANRDPSIGPPIVRMANISLDGHLDLSDLRYCAIPKNKEEHFALKHGDLLLNWRSGSSSHVGKTAIFGADGLYTCASFILRIRAKTQRANNRYLRHVLNFMRAEGIFSGSSRMQINHKLNAAEFSAFSIRIPPTMAEQEAIADVLDSAESIGWKLSRASDERAIEVSELRAAILHKAFAGEL